MQGYVAQAEYDELKAKYESQKFRLEQLERMLFGAKSERFMPEQLAGQLSLFGAPAEQKGETTKEVTVEGHTRQGSAKGQPKRLALPEHLERRQTTLEPDVDTSGMEKIGEEISEILEYEPAKLVVHRIIRPKYVRKEGKNAPEGCKVHIAALPMRPIERCMAAATLLAIICIEKYIDHLPLYRQRMRYRRLGMDFPSSTICGWVAQVAGLLEVLYDKLVDLVLQSQYLQVDETTIRVLQRRRPKNRGSTLKPKKGKTHLGYYWAFYDVNKGLLFFRYDKTREQRVPYLALKDFQGAVQVDGYSAYEGLDLIYQIVLVNCWAHARRKFDQALDNDKSRAAHVLIQLQKLYALEEQARKRQLDFEARRAFRRQKAKPIVSELFEWLEQEWHKVLPKSPIGMAINYTLKRREALRRYLHDGQLEIDNNLVENAMRPIALGRKNYLFAGSHEAAQRGAIFYSLFECCRQHEVDPYEWLGDVLNRLPAHPVNRVEELLPHLWQSGDQ